MSSEAPPSDTHLPTSSWATFFSPAQLEQFTQSVLAYFKSVEIPVTLTEGMIASEQHRLGPFGLQNLAQLCAQAPQDKWQAIINAHFDNLRRGQAEAEEIGEQIADFKKIKSQLAIRLYPESMFDEAARKDLVCRQDLEGTLTVLVFDLPSTIRTVSRQITAAWEKSDEQLFDTGVDNLRRQIEVDHEKVHMSEELYLHAYIGEGYFVAAYCLMLDEFPDSLGRYGTLIGIPHRHILLTYPIHDILVIQAINGFLMALPRLFEEGPGSITPNLYWFHQGQFLRLPYAPMGDEIRFSPPQPFLDLIENLTPPEESIH
jgi:hypothetical protein